MVGGRKAAPAHLCPGHSSGPYLVTTVFVLTRRVVKDVWTFRASALWYAVLASVIEPEVLQQSPRTCEDRCQEREIR